jgi:uncharacterized protein
LDPAEPIPPNQPGTPPFLEPALPKAGENPVFNLLDVGLIVLVASAALVLCTFGGVFIFLATHPARGVDPKDLAFNAMLLIPAQIVAYILTVGFMVFYVWEKYRARFLEAVRWNMPGPKFVWAALLGGSALGLTSEVLSFLLHRWIPKSLPFEQYFSSPASAYMLAGFGILVAPVVEELFFRGFLYPALARRLDVGPAIVITSTGFALLHSQQLAEAWAPLLILFIVGTVLTVVRAATKSVAVCVLMHMGYNLTLFAQTFMVTQGFRHMERG